MIAFSGQAILLDIEGTTSSINYVHETMFNFVRECLVDFLNDHWHEESVQSAISQMAADAGQELATWIGSVEESQAREMVAAKVNELMDQDAKSTGLKSLQGQIWKDGFESGRLVGHLYDDVQPAIELWHSQGKSIYIYSSGSIAAQQLYFGHSQAGNLLPLIDGHFDTTTGPKKSPGSYSKIAQNIGVEPSQILFLSDSVAELDAARSAGCLTGHSLRPGNPEIELLGGNTA